MSNLLVLVVEDDAPVRNLISTTLKTRGYEYLIARNGESAIMEASSHNPDVVLLDLGLPDIDGVDVIKKIRTWSEMPIIVISARAEDKDKIDALDAGADDYLTKPFSVEELLARLRVMGRRLSSMQPSGKSDSLFVNGDLKIDYAAGCAYLNGDSHRIQTAVFAVQECREGAYPHFHYAKNMGCRMGKQCSVSTRIYGYLAQKNRTVSRFAAVYTDSCRHWVPNGENR